MDKWSDFLVKNPKQTFLHLKSLATKKCLLSATFGENYSFLTAILELQDKNKTMMIDCGPKEYLNKELLSSGLVKFKAEFQGIKVFFEGRQIKKVGNLEKPALLVKMPEQIYWVQRRQFYRVRSPLSKESYCRINLAEIDKDKVTLQFKLFDLSATGFSLLTDNKELAKPLVIDKQYNFCELVLEEIGVHSINFIVRCKMALNADKPHKIQRIGCEFMDISLKSEAAFLRYMQDVERMLKNNSKHQEQ